MTKTVNNNGEILVYTVTLFDDIDGQEVAEFLDYTDAMNWANMRIDEYENACGFRMGRRVDWEYRKLDDTDYRVGRFGQIGYLEY